MKSLIQIQNSIVCGLLFFLLAGIPSVITGQSPPDSTVKMAHVFYIDNSGLSEDQLQHFRNQCTVVFSGRPVYVVIFLSKGEHPEIARTPGEAETLMNSLWMHTSPVPNQYEDKLRLRTELYRHSLQVSDSIIFHFYVPPRFHENLGGERAYLEEELPLEFFHLVARGRTPAEVRIVLAESEIAEKFRRHISAEKIRYTTIIP